MSQNVCQSWSLPLALCYGFTCSSGFHIVTFPLFYQQLFIPSCSPIRAFPSAAFTQTNGQTLPHGAIWHSGKDRKWLERGQGIKSLPSQNRRTIIFCLEALFFKFDMLSCGYGLLCIVGVPGRWVG